MTGFHPKIIRRTVQYHEDASALFAHLGGSHRTDTVLLESADITTKAGIRSVMVLKGSVRLTCNGQKVHPIALTPTGEKITERLYSQLKEYSDPEYPESLIFPKTYIKDERERLKAPSPILPLRILQTDPGYSDTDLPFITGGFAFDFLETFEDLPSVKPGPNTFPDYEFLLAEILLIIDHENHTAELSAVTLDQEDPDFYHYEELINTYHEHAEESLHANIVEIPTSEKTIYAHASISDEEFSRNVEKLQENIYQGDIYQVVPARTFSIECTDAFAAYRTLRETNPSPYMFYIRGNGYELFGASPEANLKFTASSREIELYPIAGTQPRGLMKNDKGEIYIDHELDTRAELELRNNAKEMAEHVMLVDLARNDMARVAVPATRKVKKLLQVDFYSRVMHLVSHVTATLAPDLDALDAYRACMNMGTLTGAPKLRAMELLREVEQHRRGSYGGAIGYLKGNGDMDTCIVIRSAFVRDGIAYVQAGAGVVRDSQPQSEADETLHKAYAVLNAIALSENAHLEINR